MHQSIGRARRFFLANAMLILNFISIYFGVGVAVLIGMAGNYPYQTDFVVLMLRYGPFYDLSIGGLMLLATLLYERPIRRLLLLMKQKRKLPLGDLTRARRRLLNEPYFLTGLNLVTWLGGTAAIYILLHFFSDIPALPRLVTVHSLLISASSLAISFSLMQFCLQKYLVPVFFPEGRLALVPGTLRITITVRLVALITTVCLVPFVIIGIGILETMHARSSGVEAEVLLNRLLPVLSVELTVFAVVSVILAAIVAGNMVRPFGYIIHALGEIKKGRLNYRVPVVSNDEIGFTGDIINDMAAGLKERDEMRRSLDLAKEIQQSLLPRRPPESALFDFSGHIWYCDETGGDYYDFFQVDRNGRRKSVLAIGDVSGHGISSALLMTSVRAYLRSTAAIYESASDIVSHLNQLVSPDTEETGQFITMFYLEVDADTSEITWVRAGHEPAFLYNPDSDRFDELLGLGVALGIDNAWKYQSYSLVPEKDRILLLTTDGIYEAHNEKGEMFGRDRFREVVRRNSRRTARGINRAVIEAVRLFRGSRRQEDDVTLVVLKFR